ncbi:MAG: ATP-binding protein [Spirochaetaceae bacterium]|nr:ATP-binding protein [Spirochaetaceae bacterium]
MFFGRKKELETLEKLYKKHSFELLVLYGRRRIGKTTLLSHFIQDKPAIFFSAQEANDKINLQIFSELLYQFFGLGNTGLPAFADWNSAFYFLAEKAHNRRLILVFDEFPYAAGANKGLKSILQNAIDHKFIKLNLFIILSGSHIGFMENEVLGSKSPLFGRRTAQMKLNSFDYADAADMLSKYNNEDKIRLYSCIGGTPYYLSRIDKQLSFEKNLEELFFEPSGYLYEEPLMLLKQELREGAMYHSIISAIALGATKLNDIALRTGEERSKTIKYLDTLISLNILHKEFSFGENPEKSRKGIYRIRDNCYRFWYRYVFMNKTVIEQGAGKALFKSFLPELNSYIGGPFEEICMQYMVRLNNLLALPFVFTQFGRWWRPNAEIDMVFSDTSRKQFIFAECKWRNDLKDTAALLNLVENSKLLNPTTDNAFFYLFSKATFSKSCESLANKMGNVSLISLNDFFYMPGDS